MKRNLIRPTAMLFPIVLLIAARFGQKTASNPIFLYWCMIQLFSLCSVEAFRNAAAREPGLKRVDRRFSGAFPMLLLGILITCISEKFRGNLDQMWTLIATAAFINIEQLFEERMYAIGHRMDGVILSILSNLLLFAGLLLDVGDGIAASFENMFVLCGSGLSVLISVVTTYIVEPAHGFSLLPRNIAFFPKAAMQSLLFPILAVLLHGIEADVFAAMILWRLSRTVCRRSADESRSLNLLLTAFCAAISISAFLIPALKDYAILSAVAALLSIAVFCAPSLRIYGGAALIIAANALLVHPLLPAVWNLYVGIACALAAVAINAHKAFLRKI